MDGLASAKVWLNSMDTQSVTDLKITRRDLQDLCALAWVGVTLVALDDDRDDNADHYSTLLEGRSIILGFSKR